MEIAAEFHSRYWPTSERREKDFISKLICMVILGAWQSFFNSTRMNLGLSCRTEALSVRGKLPHFHANLKINDTKRVLSLNSI